MTVISSSCFSDMESVTALCPCAISGSAVRGSSI